MTVQNLLVQIQMIVGTPVVIYREIKGKETPVDLEDPQDLLSPAKYGDNYFGQYIIRGANNTIITMFTLQEFPACCAFCLSTGAYVAPEYRGKGINGVANKLRQLIVAKSGYTSIICTDVFTNLPERNTLRSNGWADIYRVTNRRTNNVVSISVKKLDEWYD